jgi:hypothetical protein
MHIKLQLFLYFVCWHKKKSPIYWGVAFKIICKIYFIFPFRRAIADPIAALMAIVIITSNAIF